MQFAEDSISAEASTSTSTVRAPTKPPGSAIMDGMDIDDQFQDVQEDDEDDIIKEVPIFMTHRLSQSLALLQYPNRFPNPHTNHPLLPPSLRPSSDPTYASPHTPGSDSDDEGPTQAAPILARHKPLTQHLEIAIPLEAKEGKRRDRWNVGKAQMYGSGLVEGKDLGVVKSEAKGKRKIGDRERGLEQEKKPPLEKMTMESNTVPDLTNYAVMVLQNDEVHLTPLTLTYQMRPSLSHLDRLSALKRAEDRRHRLGEDDEDLPLPFPGGAAHGSTNKGKKVKQEGDDMTAISVKVAEGMGGPGGAGMRDRGNARAGANLFAPMRARESESWVDLEHYPADSQESGEIFGDMFAGVKDDLKIVTTPKEYFHL